jgi:hypothetical protein
MVGLSAKILAAVLFLETLACSSVAKVDVECKHLCLAAPGPTIPGLASFVPSAAAADTIDAALPDFDGGLDGFEQTLNGLLDAAAIAARTTPIEWVAEMNFNEVLAQLPSAAMSLTATLHLTSVTLSSVNNLDFIESLDVFLSHGRTPSASPATDMDGGAHATSCGRAGDVLRVASFERLEGSVTGPVVNLRLAAPDTNLFDCMKDEPSQFRVTLTPHVGSLPATDTPLTLSTCIGAETHLSYP